MSYELIETVTLSSAASSIEFTDIPQDGTDLCILFSARVNTSTVRNVRLHINNEVSGTNYFQRNLWGDGSSTGSDNESSQDRIVFPVNGTGTTANTFSNNLIYVSNYTAARPKAISIDTVVENNATTSWQQITAGLWNNNAAITSIRISDSSVNTLAGSTASLYKITASDSGVLPQPLATGGTISFAGGYWYHTFTSSGTFTPTQSLTCEFLIVGGGGGGGWLQQSFNSARAGGGGGGGGAITSIAGDSGAISSQTLSATGYTVTIGAGGGSNAAGNSTTFASFGTALGGGAGGGGANNGGNGAGGGGAGGASGAVGGTGNPGRNGGSTSVNQSGSGGGGGVASGTVGSSGSGSTGGAGGQGLDSNAGVSVAGGGGGGGTGSNSYDAPGSTGGAGNDGGGRGSGQGNEPVAGTIGRGGGGGGRGASTSSTSGANGGSGVVIVRYAA